MSVKHNECDFKFGLMDLVDLVIVDRSQILTNDVDGLAIDRSTD